MTSITDLIKELREKTGAGFLDCKKSLEENNNDIDKSIEALRKKGLAKASKKSDRAAKINGDEMRVHVRALPIENHSSCNTSPKGLGCGMFYRVERKAEFSS